MGVPKKMPAIGASGYGTTYKGVQDQRYKESYSMTDKLKSPYPYPGGKSDMAAQIWARLGDCSNFVEPFMGSAAVLLARPHDFAGKTETANDIDGFCVNAMRAIAYQPDETAYWCDWPVSEACLTSAHIWLKSLRPDLTERLFADPEYCDPKVAGRWLWGIASWIGDGWCVADGPWTNVDGRLVDRRTIGSEDEGVPLKIPEVGATGVNRKSTPQPSRRGVQSPRYEDRASVPRKMPEIGRSPNGQMQFNRKGVQAYRHHEGVPKQMPMVTSGGMGITAQAYAEPTALAAYFHRLSDRLRRVRFLCGDWRRACKDSVTVNHGLTAIFLDPPYPAAEHSMEYHSEDNKDVWFESSKWAAERGDDTRLRIAVCGYMSPACDAMFPATWERLSWEARGGYANQSKDGRGRSNAKREMIWFSPHCLDVAAEARAAFDHPIKVKESDYTGTMFDEVTL